MSGKLTIEDLHVQFRTQTEPVRAVNGASFEIAPGEIVGLVGESGCGKSVTARSIVRLEDPGEIVDGRIRFDGRDLTTADDRTLRQLRGQELAMVFQDPSTTLNPVYSIGEQIAEALRVHRNPTHQPFFRELAAGLSPRLRSSRIRSEVIELLETVGIPRPDERIDAYPHQFSGGMRQRAMLAIALARQPSLLIADEPTTALDTTTQAAILSRLEELSAEYGMGTLLISHDLGVVSEVCDRIVVMYDGVVVEQGPTDSIRSNPTHPYTKALLGCLPHRSDPQSRLPTVDGSPSDGSPPSEGCAFVDRCPFATADCRDTPQPAVSVRDDHTDRCTVPAARNASLESMRAETTWSETGPPASGSGVATPAADGGAETRSSTAGAAVDTAIAPDTGTSSPPPGNENAVADRGDEREIADRGNADAATQPVAELESVTKSFRGSDALLDRLFGSDDRVIAVRDVSLEVRAGETVGLVGESGCGKSTLARLLAGLEEPTAGTVRLDGESVGDVGSRTREQLEELGVVFQNPGTSLDPRRTVGESIAEPLVEAGWEPSRRTARLDELLELVGLPLEYADRYPRQLSGGQRQRVAIARALTLEPSLLILDEPTAALDVSTQATVLNLLADLQEELGLAYLCISHDLDVVRHVADRVAVLYLGELVEIGPASTTLSNPTHPYTATLLDAIPGDRGGGADANGSEARSQVNGTGESPNPTDPPRGCSFHPRCPAAEDDCSRIEPELEAVGDARSRCLYATEWAADADGNDLEQRSERQD